MARRGYAHVVGNPSAFSSDMITMKVANGAT
jgi:hypothetical protein